MAEDKERTKTFVEREVELNNRALAVIKRQQTRTQHLDGHVFHHPGLNKPWHDDQAQRKLWTKILRRIGVRHRAPKECRDTSITLALSAGADPFWVPFEK